ncbi:hypothetical protein RRG08_013886 [Elysia crispata]|uniref:Uncharacterized protein n=1 Tax=Elysia crispata TaxID=231223 RepID=A0AAE1D169_9GAST|nr:hypothetical protein RRG08_013886 [Elysia crispata]
MKKKNDNDDKNFSQWQIDPQRDMNVQSLPGHDLPGKGCTMSMKYDLDGAIANHPHRGGSHGFMTCTDQSSGQAQGLAVVSFY